MNVQTHVGDGWLVRGGGTACVAVRHCHVADAIVRRVARVPRQVEGPCARSIRVDTHICTRSRASHGLGFLPTVYGAKQNVWDTLQ